MKRSLDVTQQKKWEKIPHKKTEVYSVSRSCYKSY